MILDCIKARTCTVNIRMELKQRGELQTDITSAILWSRSRKLAQKEVADRLTPSENQAGIMLAARLGKSRQVAATRNREIQAIGSLAMQI